MTPAFARAHLEDALDAHRRASHASVVAVTEEGSVVLALADAQAAYEDAPTEAAAATYLRARVARDLAALRCNGCARRVVDTERLLAEARTADARARLEHATQCADRGALLRSLGEVIADLVAIRIVPDVDVNADVDDELLSVRLHDQAERHALRALRLRTVRQACERQHGAVSDARAAAVELGEGHAHIVEVRDVEVLALVELEASVMLGKAWDPPRCMTWLGEWCAALPYADDGPSPARDFWYRLRDAQSAAAHPTWVAFARRAILSGNPELALREDVACRPLPVRPDPVEAEPFRYSDTETPPSLPRRPVYAVTI